VHATESIPGYIQVSGQLPQATYGLFSRPTSKKPNSELRDCIVPPLSPYVPLAISCVGYVADNGWDDNGVGEGNAGGAGRPAEVLEAIDGHVVVFDQRWVERDGIVVACHDVRALAIGTYGESGGTIQSPSSELGFLLVGREKRP